jgi:SAM-dependent methyltransferase
MAQTITHGAHMARNVTRGSGLLEGYLSKLRMKMANCLIPDSLRTGRIVDVGCGSYPFFLLNTVFQEKYGIDKIAKDITDDRDGIKIHISQYNFENEGTLPYPDDFADIVTLLAVIEHIDSERVLNILREIKRILKNDGRLIITTPAAWTDSLLRLLAKLNVVSKEEINEHKDVYTHKKIETLLLQAEFKKDNMCCGYFELFMNIWATVKK